MAKDTHTSNAKDYTDVKTVILHYIGISLIQQLTFRHNTKFEAQNLLLFTGPDREVYIIIEHKYVFGTVYQLILCAKVV